ncbi:carboxypeptidase-like regulatory domain-containing protein [Mucilaginibacter mali]|uniref:Carboxypeptidase-like regulatory domain-containing protein n=1 Tax=Mucilaginibacter mali TaxID=2740462 RepID=A0A7D4TNA0_9SPHI|nr:carboxypeptidase-like regulatory domain-containing protein [Mucilaginibacter mali]QKJ29674.1 carboxypeptidase-like regulatory domain-containing protein [Mucilaginibacter mali]
MKKLLAVCLFLLAATCLYGQSVTGRVYRGAGDTTVANAVVYYSGSMNGGTMTDAHGQFELAARSAQIPIVVSCVGYYSSTVYYRDGQPLVVRLKPKQEMLKEVTITVDGMKREDEVAIFKREFLGVSKYALSCVITNIDDVNLHYNKKTRTLTASCYRPIIIENQKLGYTVSYYLNKFEKNPETVSIFGTYIFKDNVLPFDKNFKKTQQNREDAYDGSRMQFIRALWANTLDKTNFRVYTTFYDKLTAAEITVQDSLGQKYVHLRGRIYVVNTDNMHQDNPLTQRSNFTFIDRDGYFGEGLIWAGSISTQRMGDLLPFEYQPAAERDRKPAEQIAKAQGPADENATYADYLPAGKKLTPAEKDAMIFKRMVLTPLSPINNTMVVKRWQRPIRYKVYGSTGSKSYDKAIAANLKGLFSQMTASADFLMEEAAADSAVNLSILIGKLPDFKDQISIEAMDYFNRDMDRSGYFTYAEDGFKNMVQLINTDRLINGANIVRTEMVWPQLKYQLMAGLGFFGKLGYARENGHSIFNPEFSWLPYNGFKPFDKYLIRSLYHPLVKAGMQEAELDEAIKAMSL